LIKISSKKENFMAAALDGAVIIPRPLGELTNHIKHGEVPNLYVIARAIKVCCLATFRGHLYDTDSVLIKSDGCAYIHSLEGAVKTEVVGAIEHKRRYLFESADIYTPKVDCFKHHINFKAIQNTGPVSLTNVLSYLGFERDVSPWQHPDYELVIQK